MTTLNTKDLAEELHTDQKTARRFLRTILPDARPGTGGRWAIERRQLRTLRNKFEKMHG